MSSFFKGYILGVILMSVGGAFLSFVEAEIEKSKVCEEAYAKDYKLESCEKGGE